jgi:hypothetical protein
MTKITTKFNEFALTKNEDGSYSKIEGPVKLVKIVDIITDENELDKIKEAMTIDTSLQLKEIKRGQTIYLTAMLQKPSTTQDWNSQTLGVIQVRVVDFWYGLNKLNSLQANKKIK